MVVFFKTMVETLCASCTVAGYPCFFLFSKQNQVPQIVTGMGRVIYHTKAISIVIRTTLKKILSCPSVEKSWFKFLNFEREKRSIKFRYM